MATECAVCKCRQWTNPNPDADENLILLLRVQSNGGERGDSESGEEEGEDSSRPESGEQLSGQGRRN